MSDQMNEVIDRLNALSDVVAGLTAGTHQSVGTADLTELEHRIAKVSTELKKIGAKAGQEATAIATAYSNEIKSSIPHEIAAAAEVIIDEVLAIEKEMKRANTALGQDIDAKTARAVSAVSELKTLMTVQARVASDHLRAFLQSQIL